MAQGNVNDIMISSYSSAVLPAARSTNDASGKFCAEARTTTICKDVVDVMSKDDVE